MRALKMTKDRQKTLLLALGNSEEWQRSLKDSYTPKTWNPDPPELKEMRDQCDAQIKACRELYHLIATLEVK